MANTVIYLSQKSLNIDDIRIIYETAQVEFNSQFWGIPENIERQEEQYVTFKFNEYPYTFLSSDADCLSFSLDGEIESLDKLKIVFEEYFNSQFLPENWIFKIRFGIQEINSPKQDDEYCDAVSISIKNNNVYFLYHSGSYSKIHDDEEYRLSALKLIINKLNLPVLIVEEKNRYTFLHENDGFVKSQQGRFSPKPSGFEVELIDSSLENIFRIIDSILNYSLNRNIFSPHWTIHIHGKLFGLIDVNDINKIKKILSEKKSMLSHTLLIQVIK